jgi:hypothetical protein
VKDRSQRSDLPAVGRMFQPTGFRKNVHSAG